MSQRSEYDIHAIIRNYPYLLGHELENLNLKHERIYQDNTRADFVFTNDDRSIVVEVKKGQIDGESLRQALHYLDNEMRENPEKLLKGILIGRYASDTLKNEIQKSRYEFEIKLLDVDIPTKIKICDKCRKANALFNNVCRYCGSRKFITDPFLFC